MNTLSTRRASSGAALSVMAAALAAVTMLPQAPRRQIANPALTCGRFGADHFSLTA